MRVNSPALLDFCSNLMGKLCGLFVLAHKYSIAALNVGLDLSSAKVFKNDNQLFHWQSILPTNVDAPEKCNIGLHLITASSVTLLLAPNVGVDWAARFKAPFATKQVEKRAPAARVQRFCYARRHWDDYQSYEDTNVV